ncbi:MAG: hypothetical protein KDA96_22325, partial [Planctomycetaceae bacterium]|nr:hypothetical protein [Planctomycetaceae bacterium]
IGFLGFVSVMFDLSSGDLRDVTIFAEFSITILLLLIVMTLACRMFSSERERQTLDSLLTTPIKNVELLYQKQSGIRQAVRWSLILVTFHVFVQLISSDIFFNTNYGVPTYWGWGGRERLESFSVDWFGAMFLRQGFFLAHLFLFIVLVKWVATGWGLVLKSQIRAIFGSLFTIAGIALIPMILLGIPMSLLNVSPRDFPAFLYSSPVIMFVLNSVGDYEEIMRAFSTEGVFMLSILMTFNLLIWGGITFAIRWCVTAMLPHWLQRVDQ